MGLVVLVVIGSGGLGFVVVGYFGSGKVDDRLSFVIFEGLVVGWVWVRVGFGCGLGRDLPS